MHSALLRRINIQRSEQLSKIAINPKTNFFCVGDSKGFIQIINYSQIIAQSQPLNKDESFSQKENQNCFQFISNIHHKYSISLITWNVCYNKLTTVDSEGTLVVWKKKNNLFDVQMVNNREESYIRNVRWSKDGKYICFVYEDGQIYTGLVNGSHEWYNVIDSGLAFVEFSPDDKKILIGKKKEKIYIFSINGQQIGEINLDSPYNEYDIANIEWWSDYRKYYNEAIIYDEKTTENNINTNVINNKEAQNEEIWLKENINQNDYNNFSKHLMIAFLNGVILFYNDENDKEPKVVKTELTKILGAQWEPKGTFFIVAGNFNDSKEDNKSENNTKAIVLFYNLEGQMTKILVCPNKIFSFSLGNSTTIALEAQNLIYTGFIKNNYKWTFFVNTIVVGYLIGDNKYNVLYLDLENNAKLSRNIYGLLGILSNDSFCVLLTENKEEVYSILFTNNFGNVMETKKCPIKPLFYTINNEYLIISDGNYIYMIIFKRKKNIQKGKKDKGKDKSHNNIDNNNINIGKSINTAMTKLDYKLMKEVVFFIDEVVDINDINYDYNSFMEEVNTLRSRDKIEAMTLSNNYLFLSRSSGNISQYEMSNFRLIKKHNFKESIKKLGVSPFETYLWTIDNDDILRIHNIKYQNKEKENKKLNEFILKDIWELEWVQKMEDFEDNFEDSLSFAIIERNKLFFYSDLNHESDTYICTDYLTKYIDNEAIAVKLEELIDNKNNENINPNNYIKKYPNQILAQFNNLIESGKNLDEVYEFVKKNPSKNLFKKLALKSMEDLDFDTAQKSLLQINDFNGIEFLNRIKKIKDPELQKAEIAQYNSNFEEASKLFSKSNRNDLKLEMLMKLGKWDQVTEIMSEDNEQNKNTKEEHMKMAYNNYADELFEKKEYDKAEEFYNKAGNIKGVINCLFAKEEYDKAAKMIEVIPEEDEFLEEMGNRFLGLGMCHEAVLAFTRHGNIKKGIESYINCNKWEEALDLSAKNGFIFMQDLVDKFSDQFRLSGKKLDLVNLYRKANMSVEVHKYLCEIAEDMRKLGVSPIKIKKIYVLAALELERYKAQINQQIDEENLISDRSNRNQNKKKVNYLDEALQKEIDKIKNNHWRGAEAYHYYLLCQVQLHQKKYKSSCKTAMRLKFYEDILGTETIYRLIAICAYMNNCYKFFANALDILSNDEKINKNSRIKYQQMAKDFFLKTRPENIDEKFYKCPNQECNEPISEYDTHCNSCGYVMYGCVLSGKSILDNKYFKCNQCRNKTIKMEVKKNPFKHCPLCHMTLFEKK